MRDNATGRKLLKIKDLARELGVTRQTIHNRLAAGTCPVAPVPRTKPPRFYADDVERHTGRPIGQLS